MLTVVKCFLSHTWNDHDFAKYLSKRLDRYKDIEVWLDEREINIGDSILTRMAEGLEECDLFLIILSPEAFSSKNVQIELEKALEMRRDDNKKIFPILYKDCNIHPFLTGTLYADFRSNNWDHEFSKLVKSIRAVGKDKSFQIKQFQSKLKDEFARERIKAAWSLSKFRDPSVIKPLIDTLNDNNSHVARAAADALYAVGSLAIEPLIDALKRGNDKTRVWSATILGWLQDHRAVEGLITALGDNNTDVRHMATRAFMNLHDKRAVEPLLNALRDENSDVRKGAALALGMLGDERSIPTLISVLREDNSDVGREVAIALGRVGKSVIDLLIEFLQDKEPRVRRGAAIALEELGESRAVDGLIVALQDTDWHVCLCSVQALSKIGDTRAVDPLIKAFKHCEESLVREEIADALGTLGDIRALQFLIDATRDPARFVRKHVATALGKIGDRRAIEFLKPLLSDHEIYVREAATWAIKKIEEKTTQEQMDMPLNEQN